jgi:hypothetical protein
MKKKVLFYLCLFVFLPIFSYWRWVSFASFVNGDWRFFFKESLISNFYPSIWTTGFGDINITLWRYPLDFISGIFGYLGSNSNVSEKFLYFWPIIFVAPIASFLLIKKITKSNLGGFIGSLIFSYNTYFLSIDTQGHELLTVAFSWAVFAILSFIYLLETKRKIFIPLTALLLFIVGSYDLRSLYVTAGALVLYAFYHQLIIEKKWLGSIIANVRNSFLTFFILALLNLYWILPFIAAKTLTSNAVLSREILAGSFYNLQNATALFYPFWTGAEPTWFFAQHIPFAFWLYPLLAIIGLIVGKKNKQVGFWGLLAIIGIFLTKQDAPPFAFVYTFLYSHLPGFDAFREASKFYFLIIISYAVLIGTFVAFSQKHFENKKYANYLMIFLIALLLLWNTVPLVSGWIGTMFIPTVVPNDSRNLNSYLDKQNSYSNMYLINGGYYWLLDTNKHAVIDGNVGALKNWADQASINLNYLDSGSDQQLESQKMLRFINSDIGRRMLSLGSFGYIAVSEEGNILTGSNADIWRNFGNSLKKVNYLKQVNIGTQDTLLFENKIQKPHIYLTLEKESVEKDVAYKAVDFKESSQSEYEVNIKNIDKPFYLNFSDNYNSNWNLYVGKFNWFNVLLNKQKVVSNKNHFQNVVGFNSFYVNPQKDCDKNLNCSFTLLFKPQTYLYLGLIISVLTLIGAVISGIFLYKKKL